MTSWKDNNVLGSRRLVEEVLGVTAESEKVVAENGVHLRKLINDRIAEFGPNCDLNDIDVSHITNMSNMFYDSEFNGDISKWDVSNVENMNFMFFYSSFNGDISRWDISGVKDMSGMFKKSKFNGDISNWDVSGVENMGDMFDNSPLKGNEPEWYKRRARLNMLMLNPVYN